MNTKIIGIIAIVVLAAAGYFLVSNQSKNTVAPTPTNSPTQTEQTQSAPSATNTATDEAMTKEEVTVTLTTSGFEPNTITVKAGTKVVWTNKSGAVATVNSALHPTHLLYPPLNLGEFADGEKVSLVFDKAGTYKYHNHLNPGQTGTVVVE